MLREVMRKPIAVVVVSAMYENETHQEEPAKKHWPTPPKKGIDRPTKGDALTDRRQRATSAYSRPGMP